MSNLAAVVGIDVSKRKLDIALLMEGKIKTKVVANTLEGLTQLQEWLDKHKAVPEHIHLCMESTGIYSEPVALHLHDAGLKVSVVNPACIKGFAQSEILRNKNDGVDAALIARYCAAMNPTAWNPPPLEQRQLRAWSDRLLSLKEIRQQEVNRIEAYEVAQNAALVAHTQEHVNWLDQQIKQLGKDIDQHIDRHPGLKHDADLMASIPGLGATTVAKLLGHLGDLRRFSSAKALAAFVGLSPRQRSSGTSVRGRTMLCRSGDRTVRTALYLPGIVAARHNPILRTFYERLQDGGMPKKAAICAVMRKLVHQIYAVVTSGKPFDANYLREGLAIQDGI